VAMILNDFMRITCDMTMAASSGPVVMVWDFQCIATTAPFDLTGQGEVIVEAFLARHYTPIQALISQTVVMNHIAIRAWADPSDGYDVNGTLWSGTSNALMLPAANTFSIQMTRANYAMRNGRKAYPGPTVSAIGTPGVVSSAVVSAFETLTTAWRETTMVVEGLGADMTFQNRIIRVPTTEGVNPTVWSNIASYGAVKFGTQNSRKP
jgi:hypothetical protein